MLLSTLGSLTDAQKRFLATFLVEEYKYIPHAAYNSPSLVLPVCEAERLVIDASWAARLVSDMQNVKRGGKAVLLTREQESDLFLRYNWFKKSIRDIQDAWRAAGMPDLTDDQVKRLVDLHGHVCRIETQVDLINTPMKVRLCGRLSSSNFADEYFGDYWSAVNFAMLRCIRGFDVSQGFKFSTYYHRAAITHIVRDRKMERKHKSRFRAVSSYIDDSEEVSDFIQNIPAKQAPDQDESQEVRQLQDIITGRQDMPSPYTLDESEKLVLSIRYMNGEELAKDHLAIQAIANKISSARGRSLTKERVRQILASAHEKIRAYLHTEEQREDIESLTKKHEASYRELALPLDEVPLPGHRMVYTVNDTVLA